ncbi:rho GTPase-activating protein SYDE1-like [Protopterus annectens]|uniref:rho GTPase-activating protein SYDE1-like n=1 Tax=Protopterus annectens TaxID=7888 RepID=UPI001CF978FA|nr:rho GTPase-activating protein SYDE1-like [Protopterus annectens]
MAEPLLKRTFSKLRGKGRVRSKTSDLKERGTTANTETAVDGQQLPAQDETPPAMHADNMDDMSGKSRSTNVSKKHHFEQHSCSSEGETLTVLSKENAAIYKECSHNCVTYSSWSPCTAEKNISSSASPAQKRTCHMFMDNTDALRQVPLGQVRNINITTNLLLNDSKASTSATYFMPGAQREESDMHTACPEVATAALPGRAANHGAYLQSLDKNSREWVLSSGKSQGSEQMSKLTSNTTDNRSMASNLGKEGGIWYNPIPEDEDVTGKTHNLGCTTSSRKYCILTKEDENKRLLGSCNSALETDLFKKSVCDCSNIGVKKTSVRCQMSVTCDGGDDSLPMSKEPLMFICAPVSTSKMKYCGSPNRTEKAVGFAENENNKPAENRNPLESSSTFKNDEKLPKVKSASMVRKLSLRMKLPELRRRLSLRTYRSNRSETDCHTSSNSSHKDSGNVISRYHLDTSVATRERRRSRKQSRSFKSAGKSDYFSDGDSPELSPKSGKHGFSEQIGSDCPSLCKNTDSAAVDLRVFRPYRFSERSCCDESISGLMNVHLHGLEDLKPTKVESKDVFCAVMVDSMVKARTALLTCNTSFLCLNHAFNIELDNSQLLRLGVFSWNADACRKTVCCHGTVDLPRLFKALQTHHLAVKLEPRGRLYVKLSLVEQWEASAYTSEQKPQVFGVKLHHLVERENSVLKVPLLIQKCVAEIEERGLKVVGLYRLCGSAAVKKQLRDAFEKDSAAVSLSEDLYLDINVITGILKDYLRELPTPLITKTLYDVVLEAMSKRPSKMAHKEQNMDGNYSEETVALLKCLPEPEKATLTALLDHLSLVASFHEYNRMNSQNLAVCFGPVLLNQNHSSSRQGVHGIALCDDAASAVDFKQHIEVLNYLLQHWPSSRKEMQAVQGGDVGEPKTYLRQKKQIQQRTDLTANELVPTNCSEHTETYANNRYAGDWSICGQNFLLTSGGNSEEAESVCFTLTNGETSENNAFNVDSSLSVQSKGHALNEFNASEQSDILDFDAPFITKLNLKDFDTLILDLDRELAKRRNVYL